MAKPTARDIRSADPLYRRDVTDPILVCNVCGQPSAELGAFQAHDDQDNPLPVPHSLGFIGKDHRPCMKLMETHPRLYAEHYGAPGTFPGLCGPCKRRDGLRCTHPDLRANGGEGLTVTMTGTGAMLCRVGRGCVRDLRSAVACAGRQIVELVP